MSCGLLASAAAASFEPDFMSVGLDPVQTPSEEATPGVSSLQMGGFKVSFQQWALAPTDHWFYSQLLASKI